MIDFTDNKHGHLALSGIYFLRAIKELGLGICGVIKHYPVPVILTILMLSFLVSFVQIGKARAERDNVCRELYLANKKIDSLEVGR